jgi:hypothetical protein
MSAKIIPFPLLTWRARLDLLVRLVDRLPPDLQEEFFREAHKAAMKEANLSRRTRREDEQLDS